MKQDLFANVYRALTPKELAEMFMNPNAPKTEAEHWAVREIEKQRAEIERRGERIKRLREALEGIRIYGPDVDGLVWAIVQHPKIPTSHVLVGNMDRMVSQALLEFEQIRRNALEGKP